MARSPPLAPLSVDLACLFHQLADRSHGMGIIAFVPHSSHSVAFHWLVADGQPVIGTDCGRPDDML